ncbi:phosphonate C-P lyase system protein PhnG [Cuneatibacter sp. NSJ-177]|uniref:phosphonate C-P lyase system protein PhnG n=1 Tax=Cuneatibacter sp. NSJ-177 TaxID=2931401 RepID=UPI001FD0A27D|nr:phosphonate C-P lyase system protein PhnG [Cuneatibacter sp. NSJ-177]MCJ7837360.1 phosphonate C-P lyase system protein PhnG [Cuneatibacter sp. NSJ-177]
MEKKRFFRILGRASRQQVSALAAPYKEKQRITVIKEPAKSLAMIRMREPVKESLFYLGEVIVCEASVLLGQTKGTAVTMGDDFEKVLDMAVLDAAVNAGIFQEEDALLILEAAQTAETEKENALYLNTMVSFTAMDAEEA